MTGTQIALIVTQGLIFATWVFFAFRSLFRLLSILRKTSGQMLPGPRSTLSAPRLFLTDPRFASDRKTLAALTLILLLASAGFAASH